MYRVNIDLQIKKDVDYYPASLQDELHLFFSKYPECRYTLTDKTPYMLVKACLIESQGFAIMDELGAMLSSRGYVWSGGFGVQNLNQNLISLTNTIEGIIE